MNPSVTAFVPPGPAAIVYAGGLGRPRLAKPGAA